MQNGRVSRGRRWLAGAYVVYVILLAYVLVTPGPIGPSQTVRWLSVLLRDLGVGLRVGSPWPEFMMNVVLFVPCGLLGILLFRWTRPGDWMLVAFFTATAVEVAQRFLLPTRSGEARDVVANTFGAFVGAGIALAMLGLMALVRRSRRDRVLGRRQVELLRRPLNQ